MPGRESLNGAAARLPFGCWRQGLMFVIRPTPGRWENSKQTLRDTTMNLYPVLLILHLLAAFLFVGTVTFEVLFLEPVHKRLPADVRRALGSQLGPRVRSVVPWSVLLLYVAGLGLAWQHRGALAAPLASSFGLLLSVKIALAASVLVHVATALILARRRRLTGAVQSRMHLSVFCHMVAIVVLAKAMFYLTW
ncbi:hypothetical protein D3C85_228320 [compost metagenome]